MRCTCRPYEVHRSRDSKLQAFRAYGAWLDTLNTNRGNPLGLLRATTFVLKGQNKAKGAVVVMPLQGGKSLESPHPRALPQVRQGESVLWRTGDECRALGTKHD